MARYIVAVIDDPVNKPGEIPFYSVAVLIKERNGYKIAWQRVRVHYAELERAKRDAADQARAFNMALEPVTP